MTSLPPKKQASRAPVSLQRQQQPGVNNNKRDEGGRAAHSSSSSSFWNYAASSLGGLASRSCTDGGNDTTSGDYYASAPRRRNIAPLREDDDESIIEREDNHKNIPKQRPLPPQQRVRNLVDGFLSPIINCVQPPLHACVAPDMDEVVMRQSSYNNDEFGAESHYNYNNNNGTRGSSNFYPHPQAYPAFATRRGAPEAHELRQHTSATSLSNRSTSTDPSSSKSRYTNMGCFGGGMESFLSPSKSQVKSYPPASLPVHSATTASSTPTVRTVPHDNDVLCGRGNNSNRHPGNIYFRDLIGANKEQYGTRTKKEKMLLARQIVDLVLHHTDPPARFLGRDTTTGLWYDIGLPRSLEKTSQALREKTAASRVADKSRAASIDVGIGDSAISTAPSMDGGESSIFSEGHEYIEVVSGGGVPEDICDDEMLDRSTVTHGRAAATKIINHRNIPVALPIVIIPKALKSVYNNHSQSAIATSSPAKPAHRQQEHGSALPFASSLSAELHHQYAAQHRFPGEVPHPPPPPHPLSPILPAFRPPPVPYDCRYPQSTSELQHRNRRDRHGYPPVAPPPSPHGTAPTSISPPRMPISHHPHHHFTPQYGRPLPILVTPSVKTDHPHGSRSKSQQMPQVTPDSNLAAPAFPLDVFQNPEYGLLNESQMYPQFPTSQDGGSQSNSGDSHHLSPGGKTSPTREQQSKRQRMTGASDLTNTHDVNNSMDSLKEVNTSGESNDSRSSKHLTEAIATQLTLEDRVIRSPSSYSQSLAGGRRRSLQPLPRPAKISSALDLSADSMDGLAALSTAAFLRLDESFE